MFFLLVHIYQYPVYVHCFNTPVPGGSVPAGDYQTGRDLEDQNNGEW